MTLWQSAVLGLVQGLTEFLPISSSAHLALVPWIFGWPDAGLAFDVGLHGGTLLGVVMYFRRDISSLTQGALSFLQGDRRWSSKLPWFLALATLPGAAAGLVFEDLAESVFRHPLLMAGTLSSMGLVLIYCERRFLHTRSMDSLRWTEALMVGLAQAFAIVPGVSRSGATISAALALGLERAQAARFSFLLSIPIILGAWVVKLPEIGALANTREFWVGCISAALSGYLAIGFLLRFVQTRTYTVFVVYRILLALVVVGLYLKRS